MEVQINWLAVVLAMVAAMIIGSVWYAKPVFGNKWMKLIGKKEKDLSQGVAPISMAVLSSLVTAYVLAHLSFMAAEFYNVPFLQATLTTAVWGWLGFTVAHVVMHNGFEGRPVGLAVLNLAHELLAFVAMAFVIGLMGV